MSLAFQVGADQVIHGFERRNHIPIVMGKAHHQEKAPDGQHCPYVLWVLEKTKRKAYLPRNPVAKLVSIKHSHFAQPLKYAKVEQLTDCN